MSYWKWRDFHFYVGLPEGKSGRCVAEPSASEFWFGLSSATMLGGTAEFGDLGTSHRQRFSKVSDPLFFPKQTFKQHCNIL